MTEEQRALDRAQEARQVLESPAYQEAWGAVKDNILDQLYQLKAKDSEESYKIILSLQTLEGIKAMFERALEEGKLAKQGFFKKG